MKTYSVTTAINLCCAYQLSPVKDVESFEEFVMDRICDTESGEALYAEVIDEESEKSIGEQVRLYAQWCELVAPISNGGPYPTIEEYFREFVPIDYFVKNLRKMMEDYITMLDDAEEMMKTFESIRESSKSRKDRTQYVNNWFRATFPRYDEVPEFDEDYRIVHNPNPAA